ncbi:hypothetical protein ACOSQ4_014829 [Xanthoceras sorbifolium]
MGKLKHHFDIQQNPYKNQSAAIKMKKSPIKVTYISSPMMVKASNASEFRAIVQELTGKNSDVSDDHDVFPTTTLSNEEESVHHHHHHHHRHHQAFDQGRSENITADHHRDNEYSFSNNIIMSLLDHDHDLVGNQFDERFLWREIVSAAECNSFGF